MPTCTTGCCFSVWSGHAERIFCSNAWPSLEGAPSQLLQLPLRCDDSRTNTRCRWRHKVDADTILQRGLPTKLMVAQVDSFEYGQTRGGLPVYVETAGAWKRAITAAMRVATPDDSLENTRESLDKKTQKILQLLSQIEHAPSVQIQTGQPGTRRNPDALFASDDWESDDSDADVRQPIRKACHIAEFFDTDGETGDRMDKDRIGLDDLTEPPEDDDDGL